MNVDGPNQLFENSPPISNNYKIYRDQKCTIVMTKVKLHKFKSDNIDPPFMIIKQCGGCCSRPDEACKPSKNETKQIPVKRNGKEEIIEVEEHLECKCFPKSCPETKKLNKSGECVCKIKNCEENRYLDNDDCTCKCITCSTNMVSDKNTCECHPKHRGRMWNHHHVQPKY
ncbi:balbiani ring protein 3-like isoform X2 [Aethina tumida]|nr:balbiani ring protein 3-like isoform X2 [Aethina tumida]